MDETHNAAAVRALMRRLFKSSGEKIADLLCDIVITVAPQLHIEHLPLICYFRSNEKDVAKALAALYEGKMLLLSLANARYVRIGTVGAWFDLEGLQTEEKLPGSPQIITTIDLLHCFLATGHHTTPKIPETAK